MRTSILEEGKRIFVAEYDAILSVLSRMEESFVTAVELLLSAETVILSGLGKSGLIARKIAATMVSVGIPAIYIHPVDALHGDIGSVVSQRNSKNIISIILTKSGATPELLPFISVMKEHNIRCIGIIGNIHSPIISYLDVVLDVGVQSEACSLGMTPSSSTTASLVMGDALALTTMKFKGFSVQDFARSHPSGQLGKFSTVHVKDCMHKGAMLPVVSQSATFREALIEITKKGLGCTCIVYENRTLSGLITDGDVRKHLQAEIDILDRSVVSLMTKEPVVIDEYALIGEALTLMENRVRPLNVLPVIDASKRLVGVIRIHDIISSQFSIH